MGKNIGRAPEALSSPVGIKDWQKSGVKPQLLSRHDSLRSRSLLCLFLVFGVAFGF